MVDKKIKDLIATIAACIVLSCTKTTSDICSRNLVRLNEEIDFAMDAIENQQLSKIEAKSPAAIRANKRWESWSEDRLKEAQKYMDIVGSDREVKSLKKKMSEISDQWVRFLGYAQLGDLPRMLMALTQIQANQRIVQSLACSVEIKPN